VRQAVRWLIRYVIAVVLLSSIDVTYEWLSPLENTEVVTPLEWYSFVGLRNGAIWFGNRKAPGPVEGLTLEVHQPAFFPLPFHIDAGREGGAIVLAVWLIGLSLWTARLLLRLARGEDRAR
jgi:hypothetical protein